jgi:hypothetical protein
MNTYNETVRYSLLRFLDNHKWSLKSESGGNFSVYHSPDGVEVLIPNQNLVNHKQSLDLLDEAVEVVSLSLGRSFDQMRKLLLQADYDHFSLRESGDALSEGSISLASGLSVVSGVYGLFKIAASSAVNIKGKRKISRGYLDSIKMSVPTKGSFVFNFESKLYCPVGADVPILNVAGVSSMGRLINMHFANKINRFKSILEGDQEKIRSKLLSEGIDYRYCNGVSSAFSDEADNIDFGFMWSFLEPAAKSAPERVSFSKIDRSRVYEYSKMLLNYQTVRVDGIPAYLERFTRREGDTEGLVSIRFTYEQKILSTSILVDGSLYERLNEKHVKMQRVWVSGNLFFSDGGRVKVEAFEVKSVRLADDLFIELI